MDAKTVLIINAIYSIMVSVFIILGIATRNKTTSYRKWGLGFIFFALNFSILSLRDDLPIVIVGVLPHILTFSAFALIKSGLTEILNIKVNKKIDVILIVLGTICVLYFDYMTHIKAYIVIWTQSIFIFETWFIIYREKNIDAVKRKIVLWIFAISIFLQAIRFVISFRWYSGLNPLSSGSGLPYISVLFFMVYILMTLTVISIILRKRMNEQEVLLEELKEVTLYDKLTGIYNRRGFHQLFDYEYKLKKREDATSGYVIAICDADDFKEINDVYGHEVGDQVLRHLADKIRESTRETDIVARWGGEEFLIYISNVNEVDGESVINKILEAIQNTPYVYDNKAIKATLSIGAVHTIGAMYELKALIAVADKALYKAKNSGKNSGEYSTLK